MSELDRRVRLLEDFREGMRKDVDAIVQRVVEEAYQKLGSRLLNYCVEAGLEWPEMVNIPKQQTEIMTNNNNWFRLQNTV